MSLRSGRSASASAGLWSGSHDLLSFCDPVREVRRHDIERPHRVMQSFERSRIRDRPDLRRRHRGVVGPQGDDEAIALVGARRRSRLRATTGASVSASRRAISISSWATCCPSGATRAITSQGNRRTASLFELCRTAASSTARSRAEAIDLAAATARETSEASKKMAVAVHGCQRLRQHHGWVEVVEGGQQIGRRLGLRLPEHGLQGRFQRLDPGALGLRLSTPCR